MDYLWEVFGELPETRLFGWAGSSGSSLFLLGGVERFEPTDEAGTCCTSKTATNQLERPGHGRARKGLAGAVALSRRKTVAVRGRGRPGEPLVVRRDRLAAKPGRRPSGSARLCTTT